MTIFNKKAYVLIRFLFLLSQIEDEENCSYDYVEVMEGSGGLLIGRYCGSVVSGFYFYLYAISWTFLLQKNPDITSLYDELVVRFISDSTMAYQGFSMSYVAVDNTSREDMEYSNEYDNYNNVNNNNNNRDTLDSRSMMEQY